MDAMTAAHPSLPLDSWVLVRNLRNNKVAVLRINDRGPYHGNRVLDVSRKAAKRLGFIERGSTQVEIRRLSRMELAALGPVNSWDADGATEGGGDDTADTASQSQLASNLVDPSAAPTKAAKSAKPAARARKVSARRTAH
jgi:rare lipoprotein A